MVKVIQIHITKSELKDFISLDTKTLVMCYRKRYINKIYQSLNGKLPPMVLSKEEVVLLLQKQLQEIVNDKRINILTLENNETFKRRLFLKLTKYTDRDLKRRYSVQELKRYLEIVKCFDKNNSYIKNEKSPKNTFTFNLDFQSKKQNIITEIKKELEKYEKI